MRTLDLSKSVYELTQEYSEVVDIMAALGFTVGTTNVCENK